MIPFLLFIPTIFKPLDFASAPEPFEIVQGEKLWVDGKGPERVHMADRGKAGWWFDGHIRRDVEDILWISPDFASRWMGYCMRRDGWNADDRSMRWTNFSAQKRGRLWFVVRLAALPKIDGLEQEESDPADTSALRDLRFFISYPDPKTHKVVSANLIAHEFWQQRAKTSDEVVDGPWTNAFPHLSPTPVKPPPNTDYATGGYYGVMYVASCPIPQGMLGAQWMEVHVVGEKKQRVAKFTLLRGTPRG